MLSERLMPGDRAPWFRARSSTDPRFDLDLATGPWLALTFIDGATATRQAEAIREIDARASIFDDENAAWFIVTADPIDERPNRLPLRLPGIRALFDAARDIRTLYKIDAWGSLPVTVILSPHLSIAATIAGGAPAQHAEALLRVIEARPDISTPIREIRHPTHYHHTECP
ncbi:MAG: hypothetical protein ACHQAY_10560 [Hyphomicrobiales bacterium]